MQPSRVVHEVKGGLHRLIINGKVGRWEPEAMPCKLRITIEEKEYLYFASADLDSGLPEVFMATSIFGETVVSSNDDDKKVTFLNINDF